MKKRKRPSLSRAYKTAMEHIKKKGALAIFEQMWRSSEAECSRLEQENERLREALQQIADLRYDNTSAAAIAQAVLVLIAE